VGQCKYGLFYEIIKHGAKNCTATGLFDNHIMPSQKVMQICISPKLNWPIWIEAINTKWI